MFSEDSFNIFYDERDISFTKIDENFSDFQTHVVILLDIIAKTSINRETLIDTTTVLRICM